MSGVEGLTGVPGSGVDGSGVPGTGVEGGGGVPLAPFTFTFTTATGDGVVGYSSEADGGDPLGTLDSNSSTLVLPGSCITIVGSILALAIARLPQGNPDIDVDRFTSFEIEGFGTFNVAEAMGSNRAEVNGYMTVAYQWIAPGDFSDATEYTVNVT